MEYLYMTEYQRSFLSRLKEVTPSWKKEPDIEHRYKQPMRNEIQKCSVGSQTNLNNNKKVQFHLDSKPDYTKKYSSVETNEDVSYKETLRPKKIPAKESLNTEEIREERPSRAKPIINEFRTPSPIRPQQSYVQYALNLRAGKDSDNYHRAPFIQKKKKTVNAVVVNPSVYRMSSEPCLQKKRISMYPKNHNILRTSTVKEEDSPKVSGCPLKYMSSYNLDFNDRPYRHDSPIMSVDYTMNRKNSSESVRSAIYDCDDDNRYHKKNYQKGTYETEYQQYFTRKNSEDMSPLLSAVRNNEKFADYYKEVLNKRVIAYSPSLQDQVSNIRSGRSSSDHSPRTEKFRQDVTENEKSTPKQQRFVNGRYTRAYEAALYSP